VAVADGTCDGKTFLAACASERVVALLAGQPPESTQGHGLRYPLSSCTSGDQRFVPLPEVEGARLGSTPNARTRTAASSIASGRPSN